MVRNIKERYKFITITITIITILKQFGETLDTVCVCYRKIVVFL